VAERAKARKVEIHTGAAPAIDIGSNS